MTLTIKCIPFLCISLHYFDILLTDLFCSLLAWALLRRWFHVLVLYCFPDVTRCHSAHLDRLLPILDRHSPIYFRAFNTACSWSFNCLTWRLVRLDIIDKVCVNVRRAVGLLLLSFSLLLQHLLLLVELNHLVDRRGVTWRILGIRLHVTYSVFICASLLSKQKRLLGRLHWLRMRHWRHHSSRRKCLQALDSFHFVEANVTVGFNWLPDLIEPISCLVWLLNIFGGCFDDTERGRTVGLDRRKLTFIWLPHTALVC